MRIFFLAPLIWIYFASESSWATQSVKSAGAGLSEKAIYEKLDSLSRMRDALASQIKGGPAAITEETFRNTCMPVGKELKRWAEENGVRARQISRMPRNAAATPGSEAEKAAYQKFLDDPSLRSWTIRPSGEPKVVTYYMRIDFEPSCKSCHGTKDSRPGFIVTKYPDDKAFGFKVGDLRGVYQVVQVPIPDPKDK